MGFEKFGRFGYVSQTKINPLLSYLEKGQIAATRCKKCGRTYFPPRAECQDDHHSTIEWVVLDGKSSLITFTKVFFAPPAFQPETPYLLGLAELSNTGSNRELFPSANKNRPFSALILILGSLKGLSGNSFGNVVNFPMLSKLGLRPDHMDSPGINAR